MTTHYGKKLKMDGEILVKGGEECCIKIKATRLP